MEPCQFGNRAASATVGRTRLARSDRKAVSMNAIDRPHRAPGGDVLAGPLQGLPESDRTLLIVDDDAPLNQRLARAMERRGFVVQTADSVASGTAAAIATPPAFAVV